MEYIFLKLLNLSLTAGIIVVIILVLKLAFKRVPRWIHCLLWAVVAVRLICPWTPSTPMGLLPSEIIGVEKVQLTASFRGEQSGEESEGSLWNPQDISDEREAVQNNINNEISLNADVPVVTTGISTVDGQINDSLKEAFTPTVGDSVDPITVWTLMASVVWAAGMAGMLLYAFFSWLSVKRRVREAVPLKDVTVREEISALYGGKLRIFLSDEIASPFILGVIRPVIYLPSSITKESVRMVLAHENAHLARHDHRWKPLGFLLLTVYWFNPLIWIAYILFCRDIEMACDERVIAELGENIEKEYSEILLAMSVPHRRLTACPVAFGEGNVKGRIKNILNYKKPAFWIICVALASIAVISVLLLTNSGTRTTAADEKGTDMEKNKEYKLLEKASPETSAMMFSCYDGETTTVKYLFNIEEEKRIINEINGLGTKRTEASRASEMTAPPVYGLEISDGNGYDIWITYSNGLWLLKDGTVYEASYDFEKLYSSIPQDENTNILQGGIYMLNSAILGRYDFHYYEKSAEMTSEKNGITLSVKSVEGKKVCVTFTNDTGSDFGYGEYFTLQKKIDGTWYTLPVALSNYGFNDILHILPAGRSEDSVCDLTMYGELEEGEYRIEKEKMAAEFIIGREALINDGKSETVSENAADIETDPENVGADTDRIKEYLSSLPNDIQGLTKAGVFVDSDSLDSTSEKIWNDFADSVNSGKQASITIAVFYSDMALNHEGIGDAWLTYIFFDGTEFYFCEDKSRCNFELTEEMSVKSASNLYTYRQLDNGMLIVLSDMDNLTYTGYESLLRYEGYEKVPLFLILRNNGNLKLLMSTPEEQDEFVEAEISENGPLYGDYITTELIYMNLLSSSMGLCGTEVYSFTEEGFGVSPRYSDGQEIVQYYKTVSENWEDFYSEDEWNELNKFSLSNFGGIRFTDGSFRKFRYENGMELYLGNGRLYLVRASKDMIWSIYELKQLKQ